MNETALAIEAPDQFQPWRDALATGKPVAYERGTVTAGYFRCRDRNADRSLRWDPVGIWEEDGVWRCVRGGPRPAPVHFDEIEGLFVRVNMAPISYELFDAVYNRGEPWPEDVAAVETAAELAPHEAAAAEVAAQREAAAKWLAELGHNPSTQQEADRAANFADAFAKIEKRADKLRETEKEPHLTASREVDAKWKPIIEAAGAAKKKAKGLSEEFARAESERRRREAAEETARRQREFETAQGAEIDRRANEERLRAMGVHVPEFAPPPKPVAAPKPIVAEPVRIGTTGKRQSLRTVATYEIEDATSVLLFLAERNNKSAKLLDVALSDAIALAKLGIEVPGLKTGSKEEIV